MRRFLDTTLAIDYLRAEPAALARLARIFEDGDEPIVNDVVVCELATGVVSADDAGLVAFLRVVEFVQPGPDVAVQAGQWRAAARRRGRTISVPDALIAATAHDLGAVLITRNARDFESTPVQVETY